MPASAKRQWLALALGFFMVLTAICGSGFLLLLRAMSENFASVGAKLALDAAHEAVQTLDARDHESVKGPEDASSAPYQRIEEALHQFQRKHPEIRCIRTLRVVNGVPLEIVGVDTNTPKDTAARSTPFAVFSRRHDGLNPALQSGSEVASPSFFNDGNLAIQWATAPIFDHVGRRVAVIYVERDSTDLARSGRAVTDQWGPFLFVAVVGCAACATFLFWVIRRGFSNEIERMSIFRVLFLSGIFLLTTLTVLLGASYSMVAKFALTTSLDESLQASEKIHTQLNWSLSPELTALQRQALAAEVKRSSSILPSGPRVLAAFDQRGITRHLLSAESAEAHFRKTLRLSIQPLDNGLLVCALVAFLSSLASLGIVQSASANREHAVLLAEQSKNLHLQQEQIVENLSIGFFSFRANYVQYASVTWKVLFGQRDGESHQEALERSLHPADAAQFFEVLREAERHAKPFSATFRIGHHSADARYIEVLGSPIFLPSGEFDSLIGSASDVTAREEARLAEAGHRRQIEEANEKLRLAFEDLEENFEATVYSLVKAVEAKDPYTAGHSERVMELCLMIGQRLGLSEHQLRVLRLGALVHDIGKIGIPDSILTKSSSLTDEEYAVMKQHPEIGVEMIERIPTFRECIPIVLYHHERMNGRGYPYRLTGDKIPLVARICAVADCFDAMTSNRAYRKGLPLPTAIAELRKDVEHGALDPEVVRILADMMDESALKSAA